MLIVEPCSGFCFCLCFAGFPFPHADSESLARAFAFAFAFCWGRDKAAGGDAGRSGVQARRGKRGGGAPFCWARRGRGFFRPPEGPSTGPAGDACARRHAATPAAALSFAACCGLFSAGRWTQERGNEPSAGAAFGDARRVRGSPAAAGKVRPEAAALPLRGFGGAAPNECLSVDRPQCGLSAESCPRYSACQGRAGLFVYARPPPRREHRNDE